MAKFSFPDGRKSPRPKIAEEDVRPYSTADRLRTTRRRNPVLVYLTDEEERLLTIHSADYQTSKSGLIRNALNMYTIEPEMMRQYLYQAKNYQSEYLWTFKPY